MSASPIVLVTCATGKTGNIGGHVAHALHRRGAFRIRIAARDVDKAAALFKDSIPEATFVRLDLADPSTYAAALDGVEQVFLGHPESGFDDLELQQAFMDAVGAVKPSVPHVVKFVAAFSPEYVKPFETHGPLLAYGLKNVQQVVEDFRRKHGDRSITVVEGCAWFFQSYTSHYKEMVSGGCLTIGNEDAALPRIDSRDIGEAVAAVMADAEQHAGRVISLTGAERLRETELAGQLAAGTGQRVGYSNDASALQRVLEAMPLADGISSWDVTSQLWAVERHWATHPAAARLHPELFLQLTGRPYRSWSAFVAEHRQHWASQAA